MTIAALYVQPGGVYYDLPGVEPWGLPERDARGYAGPHPVVAHPPCKRWGVFGDGGPRYHGSHRRGDDGGAVDCAIASVRRFGGVMEHPRGSKAWERLGFFKPAARGGWIAAGDFVGWTCCVEQGHYGHRARKATWLYVAGCRSLPSLKWGSSAKPVRQADSPFGADEWRMAIKPPPGITQAQRNRRREILNWKAERSGKVYLSGEMMNKSEARRTPIPFRDLLIDIAKGCTGNG